MEAWEIFNPRPAGGSILLYTLLHDFQSVAGVKFRFQFNMSKIKVKSRLVLTEAIKSKQTKRTFTSVPEAQLECCISKLGP